MSVKILTGDCRDLSKTFAEKVKEIADQFQRESPFVDRYSALKLARQRIKDQEDELCRE